MEKTLALALVLARFLLCQMGDRVFEEVLAD